MNSINERFGMITRTRRLIISIVVSIFGIAAFIFLASCKNSSTGNGKEAGTAPPSIMNLEVTEALTTSSTVVLTWNKPTDLGTTDGTTAALFGSYGLKVYQGADDSGDEVQDLTLDPVSLNADSTSVTASGLRAGTQYAFKLILKNSSSLSSDSNVVTATTGDEIPGVATAPAKVTGLTVASTTVNTVVLTWSKPTDLGTTDGTTAALFGSYELKVYQGAAASGDEVQNLTLDPASLNADSTSVTVSGLSAGTQYAFKLILKNSSSLSSDSNVVTATTGDEIPGAATAPAKVTGLTVASTTVNTVVLTWSKPTDLGTTDGTTAALFGSYELKVYQGAAASGDEVQNLTLDPASLNADSTSVTVSGLSAGTQYAFKLILKNSSSLSSDSNVVTATTGDEIPGAATAPAKVTGLTVASTTVNTVVLTWSKPTDLGTTDGTTAALFGSYGLKVYQGADDSGDEVQDLTLDPVSLNADSTSVTASGLRAGTQYAFKLILKNSSSLSSDSNVVTATTGDEIPGVATAPAKVTGLTVASTTVNTVVLTWSKPTDLGTTDGTTAALFGSYELKVYQGAAASGDEVQNLTLDPASLNADSTSVTVSGLSAGTQYAFKLILKNSSSLSSDSNVVTATTGDEIRGAATAPAKVTGLTVASTTVNTVVLTWNKPTDLGTTDGTTAALFGSYGLKVYQGADDSGDEVQDLTLDPVSLNADSTSVTASGLRAGTQYAFKLILKNSSSLSSDSNVVTATTGDEIPGVATAPAKVTGLTVASTTVNTVVLTWSKPVDFGTTDGTTAALFGSYGLTIYGPGAQNLIQTPDPLTEGSTKVTVSGLSSGAYYDFKLILSNDSTPPLSTDSDTVTAKTLTPTAPAKVTDLAVIEDSTTSDTVVLIWSKPTDFGTTDGTKAALFGSYEVKVYKGADDSGDEVQTPTLDPESLDEDSTRVTVSGLNAKTQYAFQLVLSNDDTPALTQSSNIVTETTTLSENDENKITSLQEEVRTEFLHAWKGYMKYAAGHDELKPQSKSYHNWYSTSLLMTPVDAFSTMKLMGLEKEAAEAKKLIMDSLSFDVDISVQMFEVTIRELGGLLSAWQLDGDRRFLDLAKDLADRMLPAFNSKTGMPYRYVNLKTGAVRDPYSNPAEIGTLILEYGTLSRETGNPVYYDKAKKALTELYNRRSKIGLVGDGINVETGSWISSSAHIGGAIDSYYEYFYKGYLMFGDPDLLKMWETHIAAINQYLADDTKNSGFWYGHANMNTGARTNRWFGSLDAFFPGLLAVSGDLTRAKKLQKNVYRMWKLHGIEPESLEYSLTNAALKVRGAAYNLRPEAIESAWYLFRLTGDTSYQEMGKVFFESLKKYCRTEAGYTTLNSVINKKKDDLMPSFFLAETLKYLYLLLGDTPVIDMERTVFNTEAHPLRRWPYEPDDEDDKE